MLMKILLDINEPVDNRLDWNEGHVVEDESMLPTEANPFNLGAAKQHNSQEEEKKASDVPQQVAGQDAATPTGGLGPEDFDIDVNELDGNLLSNKIQEFNAATVGKG